MYIEYILHSCLGLLLIYAFSVSLFLSLSHANTHKHPLWLAFSRSLSLSLSCVCACALSLYYQTTGTSADRNELRLEGNPPNSNPSKTSTHKPPRISTQRHEDTDAHTHSDTQTGTQTNMHTEDGSTHTGDKSYRESVSGQNTRLNRIRGQSSIDNSGVHSTCRGGTSWSPPLDVHMRGEDDSSDGTWGRGEGGRDGRPSPSSLPSCPPSFVSTLLSSLPPFVLSTCPPAKKGGRGGYYVAWGRGEEKGLSCSSPSLSCPPSFVSSLPPSFPPSIPTFCPPMGRGGGGGYYGVENSRQDIESRMEMRGGERWEPGVVAPGVLSSNDGCDELEVHATQIHKCTHKHNANVFAHIHTLHVEIHAHMCRFLEVNLELET